MTDSARPADCPHCGGRLAPSPKRERGRQTKFTPDVLEVILSRRRLGTPLRYCAAAAGVGERTLRDWAAKGADALEAGDDDSEYGAFAAALKKAEADGVLHLMGKVWAADEWQSAAWTLSRCWPEHFGRHRETHPPAPTFVVSDDAPDLPPEIEGHPDVQEAIAHFADAIARVRRELGLPESP